MRVTLWRKFSLGPGAPRIVRRALRFWAGVSTDVGAGAALIHSEFAVAYQAVGTVVNDFDLQFVLALYGRSDDRHPKKVVQDHSEVLSVERDFRRLSDRSEIEEEF